MSKKDRELPYDFDLLYDIKTKVQLKVHLEQAENKVKMLHAAELAKQQKAGRLGFPKELP